MLPPHELKNKVFTKSMRGYNPVEVDDYIDFILEKYTELYRENDELERKLRTTLAHLDEMKNDEDSIRSTLLDAKRAANKIKADAEERADSIIKSAKNSCNTILADFNKKIQLGKDTLTELQRDAFILKQELFLRYSEHIKYIDKLTEGMTEMDVTDETELYRMALSMVKSDIADSYTAPEEAPRVEIEEAADIDEVSEEISGGIPEEETLVVDREPLIPDSGKLSLKDSAKMLGKLYKQSEDEIINTPDSDITDEESYFDFVKSVTGKDSRDKDADFDMLFDDNRSKKRRN